MKASGIKHDGRAEKTAPAAAVDVLGVAGDVLDAAAVRGVSVTEPPLADPGPGPPPPPPRGDPLLDPGVDDDSLSKTFLNLIEF